MGSFNKLALCCALLMQGAVLASEYIDVLDLPAKPSALARHSVCQMSMRRSGQAEATSRAWQPFTTWVRYSSGKRRS